MLIDAYCCYTGLGYAVGEGHPEEVGLVVFLLHINHPDWEMTHQEVDGYPKRNPAFRTLLDSIRQMNKEVLIPKGQFIYLQVFEHVETERLIPYMMLLYRYASAIAKADHTITLAERKWLVALMDARERYTEERSLSARASSLEVAPEEGEEADSRQALHALVGLASVKEEVERLTNFIKIKEGAREPRLAAQRDVLPLRVYGQPGNWQNHRGPHHRPHLPRTGCREERASGGDRPLGPGGRIRGTDGHED